MVFHLPPAADNKTASFFIEPVETSAGNIELFEDVYLLSVHLTVADHEDGRRQRRKSGTHQVSLFLIHVPGLPRLGECLVIAIAVIHGAKINCPAIYA